MERQQDGKYRAYIEKIGEDLEGVLLKGLEFINWDKYVHKGCRVFVKPNFTFPYYREGVTTSPELLRCLLAILKTKAGSVILGESDGGNNSFKAEDAFKGHNMHQICRETDVDMVNLSTLPREKVESVILGKKVNVELPKMLLDEIDCFLSVPVLKVHVITTVSLSLKNSWGCVPDTMRALHHQNLSYKLALIAKMLKPKMVVVDGTYALNKHGPMFGEPVKTNLVVLADNVVLADALGATLMGFSPKALQHIAVAERAGLGSLSLDDAEISRDWRPYQRHFQVKRTPIDWLSSLLFHSDALARLVMDSPLTPAIYKVASILRNRDEKAVASQMSQHERLGPY